MIFKDFDSVNRTYNILLIDPPWSYRVHHDDENGTRNARSHYNTMTDEDIIKLPIQKLAAPNCALFLWVTNPNILLLSKIFSTWGFEFKTVAFIWVKTYRSGKVWTGMGHYTRSGGENCFLALRGRLEVQSHSVKQVIIAPYTRHSEKPMEIRDRIVELYGDIPRLEVFARTTCIGWDSLGDQINK